MPAEKSFEAARDSNNVCRGRSQRFQFVMGLALLLNSKVTRISIKTFGLYGHTSFCHVFQVIRALLLGFVPTPSMQWVNGFMGWVTVRVLTPDANFPCLAC